MTGVGGLSKSGDLGNEKSWISEDGGRRWYSLSGQCMIAVAVMSRHTDPDGDDVNSAMRMNICRCGTYNRIRKGIFNAAKEMTNG